MSGVVTFDGAPPPGTINLGIGQPSADLLPVDLVRKASESFFRDAEPLEFNYGVTQGDERFLDSLAGFLAKHYASTVEAKELFTTAGNSQALDLAALTYARPGDTVFVEEPSYFLAFQILRDHGLNLVGIPVDEDGLCIESLRNELRSRSPAFTRFHTFTVLFNGHFGLVQIIGLQKDQRRRPGVRFVHLGPALLVAEVIVFVRSANEEAP